MERLASLLQGLLSSPKQGHRDDQLLLLAVLLFDTHHHAVDPKTCTSATELLCHLIRLAPSLFHIGPHLERIRSDLVRHETSTLAPSHVSVFVEKHVGLPGWFLEKVVSFRQHERISDELFVNTIALWFQHQLDHEHYLDALALVEDVCHAKDNNGMLTLTHLWNRHGSDSSQADANVMRLTYPTSALLEERMRKVCPFAFDHVSFILPIDEERNIESEVLGLLQQHQRFNDTEPTTKRARITSHCFPVIERYVERHATSQKMLFELGRVLFKNDIDSDVLQTKLHDELARVDPKNINALAQLIPVHPTPLPLLHVLIDLPFLNRDDADNALSYVLSNIDACLFQDNIPLLDRIADKIVHHHLWNAVAPCSLAYLANGCDDYLIVLKKLVPAPSDLTSLSESHSFHIASFLRDLARLSRHCMHDDSVAFYLKYLPFATHPYSIQTRLAFLQAMVQIASSVSLKRYDVCDTLVVVLSSHTVSIRQLGVQICQNLATIKENAIVLLEKIKSIETEYPEDVCSILTSCAKSFQVGRNDEDEEKLVDIVAMLSSFMDGYDYVRAEAFMSLDALQTWMTKKIWQAFLVRHMDSLSRLFSEWMLSHPRRTGDAIAVLYQTRPEVFFSRTCQHILPGFIMSCQMDAVEHLAASLKSTVSTLVLNHAHAILSTLFLHTSAELFESATLFLLKCVGSSGNVSLSALIRTCLQPLVIQLCFELGRKPDRAHRALDSVFSMVSTPDPFQTFLAGFFLGFLHFVTSEKVLSTRTKVSEKINAVHSFTTCIQLFGSELDAVIPQMVHFLNVSIECSDIPIVDTYRAWYALITALRLEDLAPVLYSILASVLEPVRDTTQPVCDEVLKILEYVVVTNGHHFKDILKDVFFVPERPEFCDIREALDALQQPDRTWQDRVAIYLSAVSDDSPKIVLQAVEYLARDLKANSDQLASMMAKESIDPFLVTIMHHIIRTIRRYLGQSPLDQRVQKACIQTIGVIGALDPDRVEFNETPSSGKENERRVPPIDDFSQLKHRVPFAFMYLTDQLLPAFRAAKDSRSQDRVAFVIQEVLRQCGLRPDDSTTNETTPNHVGHQKWRLLPLLDRETLRPLLKSKYSIQFSEPKPVSSPIYLSKNSFFEWVQAWVLKLMDQVRNETVKSFFDPSRAVVRGPQADTAIIKWLLPHLALFTLLYGTQTDRTEFLDEILTVLNVTTTQTEKHHMSMQTIFQLLDDLNQWLSVTRTQLERVRRAVQRGTNVPDTMLQRLSTARDNVRSILSQIPSETLSRAAYSSKAYARALLHFESHFRKVQQSQHDRKAVQTLYESLQRIYSHIDEPDGMEGISSRLFNVGYTLTLDQQIFEQTASGRWNTALALYEFGLQTEPEKDSLRVGLLDCLKNLGMFEMLLTHIDGMKSSRFGVTGDMKTQLDRYGIEASWRLGNWDLFETSAKECSFHGFERSCGDLLYQIHVSSTDEQKFTDMCHVAREMLTVPILAGCMESYRRIYENVLHLHMLQDIEAMFEQLKKLSNTIDGNEQKGTLQQCLTVWEARLNITQPVFRVQEPLLNLHRILLTELSRRLDVNDQEMVRSCGGMWLKSAKLARKAAFFQTAFSFVLQAEKFHASGLNIEKAKLFYAQGNVQRAIHELQASIINMSKSGPESSDNHTNIHAKTNLILGRWLEELGAESSMVESKYRDVTLMQPKWEKGWFFLGRFYNTLLEQQDTLYRHLQMQYEKSSDKNEKRNLEKERINCELVAATTKCYARAQNFGTKYIFQSLPRLLTLWLDYTIPMPDDEKMNGIGMVRTKTIAAINTYCGTLQRKCPTYCLLTAFPQLISRICHPNDQTFAILEKIILRVLNEYPQQALWHMISGVKSTHKKRADRCNSILIQANQMNQLTSQLLVLNNHPVPQKGHITLNISKDFTALRRLVPISIIVPTQVALNATLPEKGSSGLMTQHQPFPPNLPMVKGFQDEVEVMSSLQRPRKLTIIGTDGNDYNLLCKSKDDLRKDTRVLEFYNVINKLLKRDSEARRRQLYIRTYAVIPLNEENGLIEWVPNTNTFRNILNRYYKNNGLVITAAKCKEWREKTSDPKAVLAFFQKHLYEPHCPAVFHQWFLESFPDPTNWLASRLRWARTVAVMSMVGFVVGLGDRHTENILLDEKTGDAVHVDFNCLFEKGLTFEFPERVPFRLTHNMIDAFGVTGTDGVFSKSSEVTMRILRLNKDTLMSVLETFIHDPLVEWSKRPTKAIENDPTALEQGRRVLANIHNKLSGGLGLTHLYNAAARHQQNASYSKVGGVLDTGAVHVAAMQGGLRSDDIGYGAMLSVEGQVHELINQATDQANQSTMWIGWSAFL